MSLDFETAVADMQTALNEKEATRLFAKREEEARRTRRIVGEVLQKLADLTTGLDLEQLRDTVDSLAGHLEAKLMALDEEEMAANREEEEL